jgi:hypothetical protein
MNASNWTGWRRRSARDAWVLLVEADTCAECTRLLMARAAGNGESLIAPPGVDPNRRSGTRASEKQPDLFTNVSH